MHRSLLGEIGEARIIWLDHQKTMPAIAIPHFHPGFSARAVSPDVVQKLYWYSWVATWVFLDATIQRIGIDNNAPTSRLLLCQDILDMGTERLTQAGFYEVLSQMKARFRMNSIDAQPIRPKSWSQFRQERLTGKPITLKRAVLLDNYLRTVKRRRLDPSQLNEPPSFKPMQVSFGNIGKPEISLSSVPRSTESQADEISTQPAKHDHSVDIDILDSHSSWMTCLPSLSSYVVVLERCGRTNGAPHSPGRLTQCLQLYASEIPALYGFHDQQAWVNFVSDQQEGMWLGACLELSRLRNKCYPDGTSLASLSGAKSVTSSDVVEHSYKCDALHTISSNLMQKQMNWLTDISKRGCKLTVMGIEHLDGSVVHINSHGLITLKVLRNKDNIQTLQLKTGSSLAPRTYLDTRTIHFTALGIDIRDQAGKTLYLREKDRGATILTSEFPRYLCGNVLADTHRELTKSASTFPLISQHKPTFESHITRPKGLSFPNKLTEAYESSPPKENDALWLLNQYLNQYFAEGGTYWAGNLLDFPKGTGDNDRFRQ